MIGENVHQVDLIGVLCDLFLGFEGHIVSYNEMLLWSCGCWLN